MARLLTKFQHMHPNAQGKQPKEPVWYSDSEIAEAISKQFPVFKWHCVWHAIPELRLAVDENGLEFKSVLATENTNSIVNSVARSSESSFIRFYPG